jgi:putative membrane protein
MRPLAVPIALALALGSAACAAPRVMQKAEVQPVRVEDTARFEDNVAMSDRFEIESSRLALQRSPSPRVRAFAQQTIDECMATSTQMLVPVAQTGLPPPQTALDDAHRDKLGVLAAIDRRDFDSAYLAAIRDEGAAQTALFAAYAASGTNIPMQSFASYRLPELQADVAAAP